MDTWRVDQKFLERFEIWFWRRIMKISWTDHVRNEVLRWSRTGIPYIQSTERRLTGLVTSCVGTVF